MSIASMLEGKEKAYLWTFTFAEALDFRVAADRWSACRRRLVRELGFSGVRVFELHPGGHGLHIHVVTAYWYSARQVRRITCACGLGRIHAKRVPAAGFEYVAKYLDKGSRPSGLKGFRLWGAIGSVNPVRVGGVRVVGHLSYCYARARGWLTANLPMPAEDKAGRFHAIRRIAMDFYARGDFEGYETWRTAKLAWPGARGVRVVV